MVKKKKKKKMPSALIHPLYLIPPLSFEGVVAPCQVFEQLPQQMVYRERGCRWYLVGSEVLPFPLVGSQWLALNGCCYILVGLG